MGNLALILLFVFAGVALLAILGERFGKPADEQQVAKLQRWLMPLVGLMLLLSALDYFLR
jgi:hypothetical protein